ncbi:DUF6520 family protein [Flagellimonas halotolerans]|uniref:DUF6520 family protein n=1 Tax=Flagellimonas halotolerans TaxID=3112164 RepID=A0ABU6IRW1_9FLAO|nr:MULTISPECIES: DUF6520 family protein [unclassified Allomuricauda]MEC3965800.1 DUF6520 family protein [Muricauda sp. SYSU M86414]MEC4265734.1 DUF6520 family protein [Muricauda sp. SYSU M84420]
MIKLVIPALAIIFAIATSAFTSLNTTDAKDGTTITGYIQTLNDPCKDIQVDCQYEGTVQCETEELIPVYDFNSHGTACNVPLFKIQS